MARKNDGGPAAVIERAFRPRFPSAAYPAFNGYHPLTPGFLTNSSPSLPYAPALPRLGALVLDALLLGAPTVAMWVGGVRAAVGLPAPLEAGGQAAAALLLALLPMLTASLHLAYWTTGWAGRGTPGMRVLRIAVADRRTLGAIGGRRAALRSLPWVAWALPPLLMTPAQILIGGEIPVTVDLILVPVLSLAFATAAVAGIASALWMPRGQGLHDRIARSVVIRTTARAGN